jgi:peptide/nickel transport system ATP-binding protein
LLLAIILNAFYKDVIMMTTVLRTQNLNKVYSLGSFFSRIKINALDDVNLEVKSEAPVIISLVGESGSGKTTLAKALLRLVEPNSGKAMVYDRIVAGEGSPKDKISFLKSVQPIFQNPFEAFSSYRPVDAYLQTTAMRLGNLSRAATVDVMTSALKAVMLMCAENTPTNSLGENYKGFRLPGPSYHAQK